METSLTGNGEGCVTADDTDACLYVGGLTVVGADIRLLVLVVDDAEKEELPTG
jgi:hypothetical protein